MTDIAPLHPLTHPTPTPVLEELESIITALNETIEQETEDHGSPSPDIVLFAASLQRSLDSLRTGNMPPGSEKEPDSDWKTLHDEFYNWTSKDAFTYDRAWRKTMNTTMARLGMLTIYNPDVEYFSSAGSRKPRKMTIDGVVYENWA